MKYELMFASLDTATGEHSSRENLGPIADKKVDGDVFLRRYKDEVLANALVAGNLTETRRWINKVELKFFDPKSLAAVISMPNFEGSYWGDYTVVGYCWIYEKPESEV